MWILLRLGLALIGFTIRQLARRMVPAASIWIDGRPVYERVLTSRHRGQAANIVGFVIGMDRRAPTWIRMHAESAADRVFKRLGIANEVQTGDAVFDERVYVSCDHAYVHALLAEAAELRAAVLAAFDAGFHRLQFDGQHVWLERRTDAASRPADHRVLADLQAAAARLEDEAPSRLADPFVWRAVVIEGVIWALAGYAIGGIIDYLGHPADSHVDGHALVQRGLVVGGGLLLALLAVIFVWLRGSSRGHRVLVESAIVLTLALPVAGIQAVADTNCALDPGLPHVEARTVDHCEQREHRSRRGQRSYTYFVWMEAALSAQGSRAPVLQVTREICEAATSGSTIAIEVMPGRWGVPWYRTIRAGGVVWKNPAIE